MEVIPGFVSSIARDLVCGAVKEARYCCCFNNFVEDLQEGHEKLIETRNSVQDRVRQANKQTRRVDEVVHGWLKRANIVDGKVEELLKKARTKKSCCLVHCPNWICRYLLGRQLAKKQGIVKTCIEEGSKFIQIERLASLPGLEPLRSIKCLKFGSRQPAFEELMVALKNDEVTMIGLYGMGGCGKTTLAKEVGNEAKHLFNKVLFVSVSSTVEIPTIQTKIASSLQLELPEKEEMQRAQRLRMRLSQEDKILVILDDVWQMLELEDIGIPSSRTHKGCKVLITTRDETVCIQMDCQRKIHLSLLLDDEAWDLFQKRACISEGASNTLKQLARQISDECKGLPVAIAAVASTLKGKAEVEWKNALNRLRGSKRVNIEKGMQNPYSCLQLSYDNLDIKEAKSLLLLCSVFPEDYEIEVDDLTRIAIGLGIVEDFRCYEEARNEVSAAKIKLISSCLLSKVSNTWRERFKMHDLVRDVAHWIAKTENKAIECALDRVARVDYSSIRYLWCEEFPNQLDCSNLEFLCIRTDSEVSDEIFKAMGKLRVLILAYKERYKTMPLSTKSFKSLINLRSLILKGWELGDISFVGDLKELESLAMRYCSFLELPNDVVFKQLTKFRLLELQGCDFDRNSLKVIGGYSQLEELYVGENTAESVNKLSVPQALERYHVSSGRGFNYHVSRSLCLGHFNASNAAIKHLAEKAEALDLAYIEGGAKNIIPDIVQIGGGMDELIELSLRDSEEIECLADTSNHLGEVGTLFSKLRKLRIHNMEHLGALYHGLPPSGIFEKLEELYLYNCPQLTSLADTSNHLIFEELEELYLDNCPQLSSLADTSSPLSEVRTLFSKLLRLRIVNMEHLGALYHGLPPSGIFEKLQWLYLYDCPQLTSLADTSNHLIFEELEELYLDRCPQLTSLAGTSNHLGEVGTLFSKLLRLTITNMEHLGALYHGPPLSGIFEKLEELYLDNCPQLTYLFTLTVARRLVQLQKLEIFNCCGLEHILIDHDRDEIITDGDRLAFPKLKVIKVRRCGKLDYIIPINFAKGLLQLKCLEIEDVHELKYIFGQCKFGGQLAHQSQNQLKIELPILETLTLRNLPNIISICPENCYATCPTLRQFDLQNCPVFSIMSINICMEGSKVAKNSNHSTTKIQQTRLSIEDKERQRFPESNWLNDFPTSTSTAATPLFNIHQSSGSFNLSNLLTSLKLAYCPVSGSLFTLSTVKALTSLEELKIKGCHGLKHIVTCESAHENKKEVVEDGHDVESHISILPSLKRLDVMDCESLLYLFGPNNFEDHSSHQHQNKIQIELPNLEELNLMSLPGLISTCPDSYYVTCSSVRRLWLYSVLLSITEVIGLSIEGEERQHFPKSTSIPAATLSNYLHVHQSSGTLFSKLRLLTIENMEHLGALYHGLPPSGIFEKLEELYVDNCPQLTYLFTLTVARSLVQLQKLEIFSCDGLEHILIDHDRDEIITNDQRLVFPKLKEIKVRRCDKLEYIIAVTYAKGLPQLKHLEIKDVRELKYIFGQCKYGDQLANQSQSELKIELPILETLTLTDLPNIISICPENCYATCPTLRQFDLQKCPVFAIMSINTCMEVSKVAKQSNHSTTKLTGLSIEDEKFQLFLDLRLEFNQLDDFPNSTSFPAAPLFNYPYIHQSSGLLSNFSNLTRLTLKWCLLLGSLFTPSTAKTLTSLEELVIKECHGLKHIVTCESAHENKEEEIAEDVHDFKSHISVFSSLKKLEVMKCDLLQYIFPASFARSLLKLTHISIVETPKLKYLFGPSNFENCSCHQHQNRIQFELPVLEKLKLESMASLLSIWPECYYVTCPSMRQLCLNSSGLSITEDTGVAIMMNEQSLKYVTLRDNSKEKGIFHMEGFPAIKDLTLGNLPELGYIWRGAKHSMSLQNLYKLEIDGCPKLKAIFSTSVVRSLPLLKLLIIKECEELEQIIEDEENENVSNPQFPKICFSQLKLLIVRQCNKLKRLFYISTSLELPELRCLIITQNSHVEEVFEVEQGAREGRVKVLVPKLRGVVLVQLPNLNNFYEGIEFQSQSNHLVHDCPKLSIASTTTVEEMQKIDFDDWDIYFSAHQELSNICTIIKETVNKDLVSELSPKCQASSESDQMPSSEVNDANQSMCIDLEIIKERVQEGSALKEAMKATSSAIIGGVGLSVNMLIQDAQHVQHGDKLNEGEAGTFPCQNIKNGYDIIRKGSNLMDKEF